MANKVHCHRNSARPPDLPPQSVTTVDFAISRSLVRLGRPRYLVPIRPREIVSQSCYVTTRTSFRLRMLIATNRSAVHNNGNTVAKRRQKPSLESLHDKTLDGM